MIPRDRGKNRDPAIPDAEPPSDPAPTARAGAARQLPDDQPRWLARDETELPARPALTRRRIVLAALHLVEEHGLDALTMRRVSSVLQVTPMSLYNHVSDKAELVDLMTDFLIGGVVEASANDTGDWEQRLRTLVKRNFDMWQEHPGFVKVYTEGVTMGPNGLANVERALALLREAGFADADAGAAFMMLFRWNVSSLLVAPAVPVSRSARSRGSRSENAEQRLTRLFSALPRDQIPNIGATVMHLSGHNVDFGLDVIIEGFKVRLAQKAATSGEPPPEGSR